jgi:hypothetical protein
MADDRQEVVLREVAARSPMFESAWNALADRSADAHWACLVDPLNIGWVETVRDPILGDS